MPTETALVAVEGIPYCIDIFYRYAVPDAYKGAIRAGMTVKCQFGRGGRSVRAVVNAVETVEDARGLKKIESVCDESTFLSENGLRLAAYMKSRYYCTFFEAARVIMPPGALTGVSEKVTAHIALTDASEEYVAKLEEKPTASAKKQLFIMRLALGGMTKISDLVNASGCTRGVVNTLIRNGALTTELHSENRNPLKNPSLKRRDFVIELNDEQKNAYSEISARLDSGGAHLLYGVTGSGKTHIFMALIDEVLRRGRRVIVLLPEISLTFQVVFRFYERYGDILALLHSGLSAGERFDEYMRIKSGEAKVIVGTRSAVFAPVDDCGLIVIDEEQEHTYKSENTPKYNARDIAAYIAKRDNGLLLLASATPSFESFYRAESGIIGLSTLEKRFNQKPLPDVIVTDMAAELLSGNGSLIGRDLYKEIEKNLAAHEQSILFVNRRGYNSHISCPKCGYVYKCKSCGIPLTYHRDGNCLVCHYCGHTEKAPMSCDKCAAGIIKYSGYGTQRAEAELLKLFPTLRIARMDSDTVMKKDSRDKILTDFRNGKYDMLVGTQMITKGLDFPDVTLVGVLSADGLLYSSDFRAYENTFSLLTQVCGRAGRAEKQGRAVVQTYSPTHTVLRYAFNQDYKGFYADELALRKTLVYPPFCDICQAVFVADSLDRAFIGAEFFIDKLKDLVLTDEFRTVPVRVIRPKETSVPMVNGKNRVRILIKCRDNSSTRTLLSRVYADFLRDGSMRDVLVGIDMNPLTIV